MKKPAAAMKKKKRYACMKMCRKILLQKQRGRMKMCQEGKEKKKQKLLQEHRGRMKMCREGKEKKKQNRKVRNVTYRARKAARNEKSYQARSPGLKKVAAVAYAAAVKSGKAMERADSAHEAADEAKKDAVCARAMVFQNSKRIARVEETLAETMTRVRKNEERLDVDDRHRGYITPEEHLNIDIDSRQSDSRPCKGYVTP